MRKTRCLYIFLTYCTVYFIFLLENFYSRKHERKRKSTQSQWDIMNDVCTWSNPYSGITVFGHRAPLKKKSCKNRCGPGGLKWRKWKTQSAPNEEFVILKKKKSRVSCLEMNLVIFWVRWTQTEQGNTGSCLAGVRRENWETRKTAASTDCNQVLLNRNQTPCRWVNLL